VIALSRLKYLLHFLVFLLGLLAVSCLFRTNRFQKGKLQIYCEFYLFYLLFGTHLKWVWIVAFEFVIGLAIKRKCWFFVWGTFCSFNSFFSFLIHICLFLTRSFLNDAHAFIDKTKFKCCCCLSQIWIFLSWLHFLCKLKPF